MDITDFSKGINTDVDLQDGSVLPGTARDMSNVDAYPGSLEKRKGTKAKSFVRSDLVNVPGADETVIQIETVFAPKAKVDSVKDFPSASERCKNDDVTIILVRHTTSGKYRLYADILTANSFVWANTPDNTGWFPGTGDGDPFMIGRVGGVGIGNVMTVDPLLSTFIHPGVLWYGHIKRLACWRYDALAEPPAQSYLQALDEWRLSNAECYDAAGEISCRAVVSNYSGLWNNKLATDHVLKDMYQIPLTDPAEYYTVPEVLDDGLTRFLIGQTPRKFNIKMTAMYDGFQESRPLPWQDPRYATMLINNPVSGDVYGTNELPEGWLLKGDIDHNQFLRIEIEDKLPRATATNAYFVAGVEYWAAYPNEDFVGRTAPLVSLTYKYEAVWNEIWRPNKYPFESGEGFYVHLVCLNNTKPTGINYNWVWSGSIRQGLEIRVEGTEATRMSSPAFMMHLVGLKWPSKAEITQGLINWPVGTAQHDYWHFLNEWYDFGQSEDMKALQEFYAITEVQYSFDVALFPAGAADPYHPTAGNAVVNNLELDFSMNDRVGVGLLQVQPIVPRDAVIEAHTSIEATLYTGSRRLSGFRLYIKEDDLDADYRMIQETTLDYNVGDTDHGGTVEDAEDTIVQLRAGGFTGTAPSFYDAGAWVLPYLQANQYWGQPIGGANRKFLITDALLTDRAGQSLMSANLMREESETDKPTWKRGAVCGGRLFGIDPDGELQYCIFAAGVMQYDICPDSFHVSDGEEITHIVSWRGQHHLVFTDQNLWRMGLGDGDELTWSILDSFVHQGTRLWKAIVDTPMGIVYPNENGIWIYDGNRPESLIRDRWEKEYLTTYAALTSEAATYGGYEPGRQDVYLSLTGDASHPEVWLLNLRAVAWRKYDYAADKRPLYMTRYRTEFLQSFGAADLRQPNRTAFTDLALGYGCHVMTQVVPPIDQTSLSYWQYIGLRYSAPPADAVHAVILYAPYEFTIHPGMKILMPAARKEYFFPLPLGIGRNMRILFGQGELFGAADSDEDVRLSSISFRGAQQSQWSGTR